MKKQLTFVAELFKETATAFGEDKASMLAASLAYYTIFAIAPLLVIAIVVAGFFFGEAAVEGQIVSSIQDAVGREAAVLIENLVSNASQSSATIWATLGSTAVLLFGASNLFNQLQRALNVIWDTPPSTDSGIVNFLQKRLIAFAMVLIAGLVLLLTLIVSTVVQYLDTFLTDLSPLFSRLIPIIDFSVSFLILTLLFAILFRVLPEVDVAWQDVFLGAVVTSLLFSIGKYLITLYLSFSGDNATYQAAGSIVILLLWVYYSAQIVLFGAEFTNAYAKRSGSLQLTAVSHPSPLAHLALEVDGFPAEPDQPVPDPPAPRPPETNWQIASLLGIGGILVGALIGWLTGRRK